MSKLFNIKNNNSFTSPPDVYKLLESITGNLGKLFKNLKIQGDTFEIKTPHTIIKLLQTLLANGIFAENIMVINEQVKQAAKKSEDMHMELFSDRICSDEYERKIEQLNQSIIKKDIKIKEVQAENTKILQDLYSKSIEFNEIIKKKDKTQMDIIESLIAFRDSIVLRDGLASDGEKVDGNKLLTSLVKETARVFEKNGVKVLEEKGTFNSSIQKVTDVKDTNEKELQDIVADVFRAGYIFENKMIRPEEVILYRYSGK